MGNQKEGFTFLFSYLSLLDAWYMILSWTGMYNLSVFFSWDYEVIPQKSPSIYSHTFMKTKVSYLLYFEYIYAIHTTAHHFKVTFPHQLIIQFSDDLVINCSIFCSFIINKGTLQWLVKLLRWPMSEWFEYVIWASIKRDFNDYTLAGTEFMMDFQGIKH